jgi:hypothetical protein
MKSKFAHVGFSGVGGNGKTATVECSVEKSKIDTSFEFAIK